MSLKSAGQLQPIAPAEMRYIKLGRGGSFAEDAIEKGVVNFGYHSIDHNICIRGDWPAVAAELRKTRKSEGAVTSGVREVQDFYTLDENCLWITFAKGHLYWTFAKPEVHVAPPEPGKPSRFRRTVAGWKKTDIQLKPLKMDSLSSRLTQLAAYRATICAVKPTEYLLRQINCQPDPLLVEAEKARDAVIQSAQKLIGGLHWRDLEILTDLIFARSGWIRTTQVGDSLADVDMILEQPTIREKAFVQVKSRANQSVLNDYLDRFEDSGFDRFFFICNLPSGALSVRNPNEHLLSGKQLAETAVQNGLFDWLMDRTG